MTLLAELKQAPIGPLCEIRLQGGKPLGGEDVYHGNHVVNGQRLGSPRGDASGIKRGILILLG